MPKSFIFDWKYSIKRFIRRSFLGKLYYYINSRFIDKYHIVKLRNFPLGGYRDKDFVIFEAVFQVLYDYVTQECAHLTKIGYDEVVDPNSVAKEYFSLPWWKRIIERKEWNEKLGLEYLDWEASLGEASPYQAEGGKALGELFRWYMYERPARVEPMDAFPEPELKYIDIVTGMSTDEMISDVKTSEGYFRGNVATKEYSQYCQNVALLESKYYDEDTQKAQEVLKYRSHLWT